MSKTKCSSSPYLEKYLIPNLPRDKTSMREQNVLYFGGWGLVTFMSINSQSYASIFDWSTYYLSMSCLIGEDLTPMPHSLFLHFSFNHCLYFSGVSCYTFNYNFNEMKFIFLIFRNAFLLMSCSLSLSGLLTFCPALFSFPLLLVSWQTGAFLSQCQGW